MQLFENYPLEDKHTFHLKATTHYWGTFDTVEELQILLHEATQKKLPVFLLGSGSNVLFTSDYPGLILPAELRKWEVVEEDERSVLVRAGSGITWDELVSEWVTRGWSGAENLSGIPGTVGAVPIQNIGAYGVEAASIIERVEAFDLKKQEMHFFSNEDCHFGYRDSVFKHELKNTYAICYVTFRLSKVFNPVCHYAGIKERISDQASLTLPALRAIILAIRQDKLPDPAIWGNAGSFFMNPEISEDDFNRLKEKYPTLPGWPTGPGRYKISAAWCIEQAGWKGKQAGRAGVFPNQPLVIINRGGASAAEIMNLAEQIQKNVYDLFGVELRREVLYI